MFSRINLGNVDWLSPTYFCEVCYNENTGQYLFLKVSYTGDIQTKYDPLTYQNKLLKATKHNDEISITMYHEGEYHEYTRGTSVYKGTYTNTYKQEGDEFYWVSAYGADEE